MRNIFDKLAALTLGVIAVCVIGGEADVRFSEAYDWGIAHVFSV